MYKDDWYTPLNTTWKCQWGEAKWMQVYTNLWKCYNQRVSVFYWKVMHGALPTGMKISRRGLVDQLAQHVKYMRNLYYTFFGNALHKKPLPTYVSL